MRSGRVECRGLPIAYTEWGDASAPPVLLLHGYKDHGYSWFAVAERLADRFHLVAPDFRGHGRSGWVGAGGYYHFYDYYLDTALLVDALFEPDARLALVGHSMGASVAAGYGAAFASRIVTCVLVEGLGLPDSDPDDAPARIATWIDGVRAREARPPTPMEDLDEAVRRICEANPRVDPEFARQIAVYGTRRAPGGGLLWAYDPLHLTRSPKPFYLAEARAAWRRLPRGVLIVAGAQSPFRHDDLDERLAAFDAPVYRVIDDAAHNVHHERPEALAALLAEHLSAAFDALKA